jgi:hypothetical protein
MSGAVYDFLKSEGYRDGFLLVQVVVNQGFVFFDLVIVQVNEVAFFCRFFGAIERTPAKPAGIGGKKPVLRLGE